MASESRRWRIGGIKDKTPGHYQPTRPSQRPRRASWARATARIAASRAPRVACPSLARAAATAVAAPACVFFGGVFTGRWRGTRRRYAIAATVKAPRGRRMSDLEQERRVARGRAVREARLDGGDDAARHAVAVAVGLAAPGAPRLVAGRLEPREALVPLVGPALGAPVPRLRLVALRGGVRVGVGVAAVARRPAPERRERLRERACVAWTFVSLHAIEPTRSRGRGAPEI